MRRTLERLTERLAAVLAGLVFLVPMYMVLVNSLKSRKAAGFFSISLPEEWMFSNYLEVLKTAKVFRGFFNGMIVSIGSGIIILAAASLAAFIIARSSRKSTSVLYYIFLSGLVIPIAFIPTYLVLNSMDLLNTYAGLILINATFGLPMSIFLFTGFIKTVPRALDEAAIIDGCSLLRMFYLIVFPLMKPVTITLALFNFVGSWNEIQIPLYFANSDKWGLPLTVYNFYGAHSSSWNLIFADVVITVLPLLVIYVLGQKYIVSGMIAGAVKS